MPISPSRGPSSDTGRRSIREAVAEAYAFHHARGAITHRAARAPGAQPLAAEEGLPAEART